MSQSRELFRENNGEYIKAFIGDNAKEQAKSLAQRVEAAGVHAMVRRYFSDISTGYKVVVSEDDYPMIRHRFTAPPVPQRPINQPIFEEAVIEEEMA